MSDELQHIANAAAALDDRHAADHPQVQQVRMSAEARADNIRRQQVLARKLKKGTE